MDVSIIFLLGDTKEYIIYESPNNNLADVIILLIQLIISLIFSNIIQEIISIHPGIYDTNFNFHYFLYYPKYKRKYTTRSSFHSNSNEIITNACNIIPVNSLLSFKNLALDGRFLLVINVLASPTSVFFSTEGVLTHHVTGIDPRPRGRGLESVTRGERRKRERGGGNEPIQRQKAWRTPISHQKVVTSSQKCFYQPDVHLGRGWMMKGHRATETPTATRLSISLSSLLLVQLLEKERRRGGILSRGGEKKDGIFVNNRVNIQEGKIRIGKDVGFIIEAGFEEEEKIEMNVIPDLFLLGVRRVLSKDGMASRNFSRIIRFIARL